jgi:hypothetical protein
MKSANCHWDFKIWNLLGPALSLSKGDYKNLEVENEDNTQFEERPLLGKI